MFDECAVTLLGSGLNYAVQVLEVALGDQYDRLYFGDVPDPETGGMYQVMWARNKDTTLVPDALYALPTLGV